MQKWHRNGTIRAMTSDRGMGQSGLWLLTEEWDNQGYDFWQRNGTIRAMTFDIGMGQSGLWLLR
jgi:hypothetical protein